MNDRYVKLEDVCNKASSNIAQKNLDSCVGVYPIYGASGLITHVNFYQREKEYIAIVKDGAGVGRTMLLPAKSSVIGTLQYIIPNFEQIDIRYLYFVIVHMELGRYFSGATIPHIYFRDYQKECFKLPSLARQKSIADILQNTDSIIEERQKQLSLLDELVKSRFIEMFGDSGSNPMQWPVVAIGSVIKSSESGWSGNGRQREKKAGEIAVLKVSAVTKGYFIPDECKVLDDQKNIKKYVFPQKGDLLFSRANTREMVGATAIINQDYPELIFQINFGESDF